MQYVRFPMSNSTCFFEPMVTVPSLLVGVGEVGGRIVAIQPESAGRDAGCCLRACWMAGWCWMRLPGGARVADGGPLRGYGGAVAGGSQGPSVNSRVRASRASMPHFPAGVTECWRV